MRWLALGVALAFGCTSTKELWKPRESSVTPRVVATANLPARSIAEKDGKLAVELRPHGTKLPPRLRADVAADRTWLVLDEPLDFAWTARAALDRADAVFVDVSRTEGADGRPAGTRVRLRLEGVEPVRAERLDDPPPSIPGGLDRAPDATTRLALGRGMDALMALEEPTALEIYEWAAVVDDAGAPVDAWWTRLRDDTSGGCRVVIRRHRPGAAPEHFVAPLDAVLFAAHLKRDGARWTWEGEWNGRFAALPEPPRRLRDDAMVRYEERKRDTRYRTLSSSSTSQVSPGRLVKRGGAGWPGAP